jgi:thiamine-phosphate pyrophosphorylase
LAVAYLDGGARLIQLRAKTWASGAFLDLCDAVVRRASAYEGARIIVNDRVDLARLSGAAGVHVGQDDLSPEAARRLLGEDAIVGVSTHSVSQITGALETPSTYFAVGPVFGTATKDTGYETVGLALVRAAVAAADGAVTTAATVGSALTTMATPAAKSPVTPASPRPVVAIGGITLERAESVWLAGATSVAVIGDLLVGGDPAARVASYNRVASAAFLGRYP